MDFLEKDLEQIIYEATDEQVFDQLYLKGKRFRQLRIGNYGISDLIFVRKEYKNNIDYQNYTYKIEECGIVITICELKKDKIGISAFLQAINYAKGVKEYLEKREFYNFNIEILLCGRSIDSSGGFIYLTDLFNQYENYMDNENDFSRSIKCIDFYTYSYGFDGIKFKKEDNYTLVNNGF